MKGFQKERELKLCFGQLNIPHCVVDIEEGKIEGENQLGYSSHTRP